MGTTSEIGVLNPDGTITYIFCKYDGYPTWVGKCLEDHYGDIKKARKLISLGDIETLNEQIGEKHDMNLMNREPYRRYCKAFHRDGGREWKYVKPQTAKDTDSFFGNTKRIVKYRYLLTPYGWQHRKIEPKATIQPLQTQSARAS